MQKQGVSGLPFKSWLAKGWVQWLIAAIIFFLIAGLYMGRAITDCSTTTTALNSDTSGGFGWIQWASGNHFSWGHTDKSNYPYGENLGKPQYAASAVLIFIYKLFSVLTNPICGLNLIVLLGYTSTALLMFGLVRWLFKRFDIALFAGYAAGFVPYHQIKAQSHINYMFGSTFIAILWAYLWFISRPSYKRGLLLGAISAISFYFDGYFVLIAALLLFGLYISSYILDFLKIVTKQSSKQTIKQAIWRTRRLIVSMIFLAVLLIPLLYVQKTKGSDIQQTFAAARGDIRIETIEYGARPIEFFLPSFDNPLLPASYQAWRLSPWVQHNSNISEDTLYVGYTVGLLSAIAIGGLIYYKRDKIKFQKISYAHLILIIGIPLIILFLFSMPSRFSFFGHRAYMPTRLLIKLTSNWRVMARLFLAMDPLIIVLASLGLYLITRKRRLGWRLAIVAACSGLLFLEYLPSSFNINADLYKDSPQIYHQLARDPSVKVVAEYPLTDFVYAPTIFTFQPVYNKPVLNANDSRIERDAFDTSIAGLNDTQTLGALKALKIDVVTSHGQADNNPGLVQYYPPSIHNKGGIAPIYSYRIVDNQAPRDSVLLADSGYSYFSLDKQLISHRVLIKTGTLKIQALAHQSQHSYQAGFTAQALCGPGAQLSVTQSGKNLWSDHVGSSPVNLSFAAADTSQIALSTTCPVDITNLYSQALVL